MVAPADPTWSSVLAALTAEDHPAARANAWLLEQARHRWEGHVVPRASAYDLLFTLPGGEHPFRTTVRVQWLEGSFELWLVDDGFLVTADRCDETAAPAVLDSFLLQLTGEG